MISSQHRLRTRLLPYLLLLPAALLLGGVLMLPIIQTFQNAFRSLDRYGTPTGATGLMNFRMLLADTDFRHAFSNTLLWTFSVVSITLLISLPAALLFHRRFLGRPLARAILILPWAASLVISAIVWRYILDGEVGPLNALLYRLGLLVNANRFFLGKDDSLDPISWRAQWITSFPAMAAVAVFVSIPFTTTVFLAGLQSLPGELLEAARVDGASPLRAFWNITLPHLRGVTAVATVVNVINIFNSFPLVWTITRGDPAGSTDLVMTSLYKKAFTDQQFGVASAQAVLVFATLLGFTLVYALLARRQDETA